MFTSNSKSIAGTPQSVTTTVSNMENNIQSALLLKSAHEYRHWLGTYVRFLAKENMQNKIRETFDMLMGPAPSSVAGVPCAFGRDANEPAWEPKILGMSKHDLLNEFLPAVGSQLCMQRIYSEYKEHLNHLINGNSQRGQLFPQRIS